jgi:hypothetical protein
MKWEWRQAKKTIGLKKLCKSHKNLFFGIFAGPTYKEHRKV